MAEMFVVDEANRDDLSRKAGLFLYAETRLWLENDQVHREDGPAIVSPDGVERWYLRGVEVTRPVKAFFATHGWPAGPGLDSADKRAAFAAEFLT